MLKEDHKIFKGPSPEDILNRTNFREYGVLEPVLEYLYRLTLGKVSEFDVYHGVAPFSNEANVFINPLIYTDSLGGSRIVFRAVPLDSYADNKAFLTKLSTWRTYRWEAIGWLDIEGGRVYGKVTSWKDIGVSENELTGVSDPLSRGVNKVVKVNEDHKIFKGPSSEETLDRIKKGIPEEFHYYLDLFKGFSSSLGGRLSGVRVLNNGQMLGVEVDIAPHNWIPFFVGVWGSGSGLSNPEEYSIVRGRVIVSTPTGQRAFSKYLNRIGGESKAVNEDHLIFKQPSEEDVLARLSAEQREFREEFKKVVKWLRELGLNPEVQLGDRKDVVHGDDGSWWWFASKKVAIRYFTSILENTVYTNIEPEGEELEWYEDKISSGDLDKVLEGMNRYGNGFFRLEAIDRDGQVLVIEDVYMDLDEGHKVFQAPESLKDLTVRKSKLEHEAQDVADADYVDNIKWAKDWAEVNHKLHSLETVREDHLIFKGPSEGDVRSRLGLENYGDFKPVLTRLHQIATRLGVEFYLFKIPDNTTAVRHGRGDLSYPTKEVIVVFNEHDGEVVYKVYNTLELAEQGRMPRGMGMEIVELEGKFILAYPEDIKLLEGNSVGESRVVEDHLIFKKPSEADITSRKSIADLKRDKVKRAFKVWSGDSDAVYEVLLSNNPTWFTIESLGQPYGGTFRAIEGRGNLEDYLVGYMLGRLHSPKAEESPAMVACRSLLYQGRITDAEQLLRADVNNQLATKVDLRKTEVLFKGTAMGYVGHEGDIYFLKRYN